METTVVREIAVNYRKPRKLLAKINSPESAVDIFRKILPTNSKECFMALYLDAANQVIAYSVVGIGIANACQVHPREVLQPAIACGACALIVAHNHPSGLCDASASDYATTRELKEASGVLGLSMLDHIVFTATRFESTNPI